MTNTPRSCRILSASGGGRAVGALGDDLRLDAAGVVGRDLVLERGRDQDVARRSSRSRRSRERLAAGEAVHGPCCRRPLRCSCWHVESRAGCRSPPLTSATATIRRAVLREQLGADTSPTLPKPWTATRRLARSSFRCAAASRDAEHARRARWPRAGRASRPGSTGLPVTTAVSVRPRVHGVGVHDPRHDLLVGVHVGGGHVVSGPNRSMRSAA